MKKEEGNMHYSDEVSLDMFRNIPEVLSRNSGIYGDKEALSVVNGISYSYSELNTLSRHIASMLYALGVEPDDRISIYSENNPHWVAAYFGILTTGAITVPILPDFQGKELATILEHSEAKVVFISGKLLANLNGMLPPNVSHIIQI